MRHAALHRLLIWLGLFGFWVVLSGKLDALHLAMGAGSAALVTWLSADLLYTELDGGGRRWLTQVHPLRFLAYLPWLAWEIVKANWQVLKLVLGPLDRLSPRVVRFRPAEPASELSRVVLANSITLTPGTVTLDVEPDGTFVVHALDAAGVEGLLEGGMQRRVAAAFEPGVRGGGVTGFLVGASVALALLVFFPLYRIARGPTVFDRLLGAGMMGTKTTVLLVVMGFAVGRADMFVDVSLGYALALLVGTVVTTKYLEAVAAPGGGEGGPDGEAP